jgi:hypothetical protein
MARMVSSTCIYLPFNLFTKNWWYWKSVLVFICKRFQNVFFCFFLFFLSRIHYSCKLMICTSFPSKSSDTFLKKIGQIQIPIRQAMKVHLILQNHDRIQSMNKAGTLDTTILTRLVSVVSLHSYNVCTKPCSGDPGVNVWT